LQLPLEKLRARLTDWQTTSSVASFLFPLFASYKALKTWDPAELTPWLMYWVVLSCALLAEAWLGWFLVWCVSPSPKLPRLVEEMKT